MRLYCLPYAGGSATVFQQWVRRAPSGLEIVPLQLPGRGPRFREPAVATSPAVVASLLPSMRSAADSPFALFGHSMGALIAFELARAARGQGWREPSVLFVSACAAPPLFSIHPKIHHLPEDQFVDRIRRLSGTPPEVLENREMMELLLPGLRADFAVCDTYEYVHGDPLDCPIVAFGGDGDDEVTRASLDSWAAQSRGSFAVHIFNGGHFFLLEHWP